MPKSGLRGSADRAGGQFGQHSIHKWESPSLEVHVAVERSNHTRFWITLGCSGGIILFILVPCLGWFFCKLKRNPKDEIIREESEDLVSISKELKELLEGGSYAIRNWLWR